MSNAEFNKETISELKKLVQEGEELVESTKRGVETVSNDTREMNIGAMNRNMDALQDAIETGTSKSFADLGESLLTAIRSYETVYANLD